MLTLQNLGWHYYSNRAAAARGAARAAFRAESSRFRRFDSREIGRYRRLVVMSKRDRGDAARLSELPLDVVPNGVATEEIPPSPEPADGPPTVAFTGTMNHPPNAEGALWLGSRVWPTVRREHPEARLLVVGRDPPAAVQALSGRDGIEVTGAVPDVSPYFARAHAVAVPLLSGGGTRLKVLEAMAARRAVVSTTVGSEGLEMTPGADLLMADEPSEFAAALLELLDDGELRARLGDAGRRLVQERYDWRTIGERFARTLERRGHERS